MTKERQKQKHPLRIYSLKINTLLERGEERNTIYPHKFMRMMEEKEIDTYLGEVRDQIINFGICPDKNPLGFNDIFNGLVDERDEIYQEFKLIDQTKYVYS